MNSTLNEKLVALRAQLEAGLDEKVEYRGRTFPSYNKPIKSDRHDKKKMVLAKKGDEVKLIHFGQKGYKHNYSAAAKKNYLARSAGIKGKDGRPTKNDKLSANYWARKILWPKGKKKSESVQDRMLGLLDEVLTTLYLRHRDGATHQLSGARLKKLRKEILAGRGGPEITALVPDYEGFMGNDGDTYDFDGLGDYFRAGN